MDFLVPSVLLLKLQEIFTTDNSRLGLSPYLQLLAGVLYSYHMTPFELSAPITITQSTFLSLRRASWRAFY